MKQIQKNQVTLAALLRDNKKHFVVRIPVNVPASKRKVPAANAYSTLLKNAPAKPSGSALHTPLNRDSIKQIAASKFAAPSIGKAGR